MLDILYEDNHLIAINKKAGDRVQGDKTGDTPLSDFVKAYIKKIYKKPGEVFLGTIIDTGAQVNHHNVIKECVTIDPGVVTAGNVTIGRFTKVHTGTIIINRKMDEFL